MAYAADLNVPFGTETLWPVVIIDCFVAFAEAPPTRSVTIFHNRMFHSGTSSYHNWSTYGAPDPVMSAAQPPQPRSEYTDHVVAGTTLQKVR